MRHLGCHAHSSRHHTTPSHHSSPQALCESHLDAHLGSVGYAMSDGSAIAAALDRAIRGGRCSDHSRLRLLGRLAAVEDFTVFFELMAEALQAVAMYESCDSTAPSRTA